MKPSQLGFGESLSNNLKVILLRQFKEKHIIYGYKQNETEKPTFTDVRSFFGFTNYYRQFIPKYAHIAKPLNLLTSVENACKKNKMVDWKEECQQACDKLKELCANTPVLAFADYSKTFKVHMDASGLVWRLCCIRLKGTDLTE